MVTVVCEKKVTVIESGGSSEMLQIRTFWQQLVIVDFDDVSLQKYGQFII